MLFSKKLELLLIINDKINKDWKYPVDKGFLENPGNPLLFYGNIFNPHSFIKPVVFFFGCATTY
jgi:hypothetical protein